MRLLNTTDFTFHEFSDADLPLYAILSHCWSQDPSKKEVTFQQALEGRYDGDSYGWQKVTKCCAIAQRRELDWAWIDTCCIDKTSSAELTETINSMYLWYQGSKECYVFLDDVEGRERTLQDGSVVYDADPESFRASRWFTRGWTLQELLAPPVVFFYDQNGDFIASRSKDHNMISEASSIHSDYLLGWKNLRKASTAQRMSWASKRHTTRVEDRAYSLLGIFDVNMPLLYGEGTKAFLRLQLAIIEQFNDQSIFAWGIGRSTISEFGILAQGPSDFAGSENVINAPDVTQAVTEPTQVTNQGIAYPYTTTVGEWLWKLWHWNHIDLRLSIYIRLPCVVRLASNDTASLRILVISSISDDVATYFRAEIQQNRDSGISRLLHMFVAYESKLYLEYAQKRAHDGASGYGGIRVRTTRGFLDGLPRVFISGGLFACGITIALDGLRSKSINAVLILGLLLWARDAAKGMRLLLYIQDVILVALGLHLQYTM